MIERLARMAVGPLALAGMALIILGVVLAGRPTASA